MEALTLSLFCGVLIVCLLLRASVVYALLAGLALFCGYARYKRTPWALLWRMILSGVKAARNILLIFLLIGMLTALWRASGTIPLIICYAANLIRPGTVVLMAFLLNCAVSVLTGTAFGTAATMGVISMTMATAMGVSPLLAGGAVLSGVFFGDRCSPVSTSALLVGELTGTVVFDNIKVMVKTALMPFLATCAVYGFSGLVAGGHGQVQDLGALFGAQFDLHLAALIPAALILLLSALRVNVKVAMGASILSAWLVALLVQHMPIGDSLTCMLTGFRAQDARVGALLDGGGIASMVRVAAIVLISSAYAGIFAGTGLLGSVKGALQRLGGRITPFGATLVTACISSMIACNQTLAIMLTSQLCGEMYGDNGQLASALEDSAVVVAPLVPWSIAGAVPLSAIGAPAASVVAACFLYLLPGWRLARALAPAKEGRDAP